MDFICMDLIGEFHPLTSRGHCYALTAVCMLTGFTWCVPLKTKTAKEVMKAYMDHIYSNFRGSIKILTDSGMELKKTLQGSCRKITPLQTTKQWENRRISQIPENMYRQAHQLQIGVGRAHTNGNSML